MIRVERTGDFWQITLNRPQKANSLTADMLTDLIGAVAQARDKARVLSITGAGNVFSAGADLDQARAGLATSGLWEDLSGAVADLPCLTIAALNGTVAGGAFGMVLACDIRVAVAEAKFFYPVMQHGFLPQPSDPVRMRALIGPARSKMILLAGQKITAQEAISWGLVDRIVQPDDMQAEIAALGKDALAADPALVSAIKAMHSQREKITDTT